MTGVVNSHFTCSLGPIDVHLLLRFASESSHWHNAIVCSLGSYVLLSLQSSTSHFLAPV